MRRVLPYAVVLVTVAAEAASACPNCVDPRAKNQQAFVASTAFLSLMPLIAVFGVIYWLSRKAKKAHSDAATLP